MLGQPGCVPKDSRQPSERSRFSRQGCLSMSMYPSKLRPLPLPQPVYRTVRGIIALGHALITALEGLAGLPPEQVLDENHRQLSEEQMQMYRSQAEDSRLPKPPTRNPAATAPLNDPYAAPEVYAARPPPSTKTAPPARKSEPAPPVTHTPSYPRAPGASSSTRPPAAPKATPTVLNPPIPKATIPSPKSTEVPASRSAPSATQPGDPHGSR